MSIPVLQGSTADIMFLIAEGYYSKVFNENGRIVLLNEDSQSLYLPTEEVEHCLEIIWGYEQLGQE